MRPYPQTALVLIAFAALFVVAACSSGTGPIGVGPVGLREPTMTSNDDPHDAGPRQSREGDDYDDRNPPAGDGGAPLPNDAGGGGSGLADTCAGSFDCSGSPVTLSKTDGKCTFSVNGLVVIMNPDGTLRLPTGESAGVWSGDATGFTVTGGPEGKTTTCSKSGVDGG